MSLSFALFLEFAKERNLDINISSATASSANIEYIFISSLAKAGGLLIDSIIIDESKEIDPKLIEYLGTRVKRSKHAR